MVWLSASHSQWYLVLIKIHSRYDALQYATTRAALIQAVPPY
jgi:hypothetical protein